jgi:Flp pilus assembly protein TadB
MAVFLDRYERKARLAPAIIVAVPPLSLLTFLGTAPAWLPAIPVLVAAATAYLLVDLVRTAGRSTERRLTALWGALPTVLALRYDASGSPLLRDRRRALVERVAGVTLPTRRREHSRPEESNAEYQAALKTCINTVRTGQAGSELLFIENRNYGFRRNLRGLKMAGIIFAIGSIVAAVTAGIALHALAPSAIASAVATIALALWIVVVRDSWVRSQADIYSEQFFSTLDTYVGSRSIPNGPPE